MSAGDSSAFPLFCQHPNGNEVTYGLSKREYFAGLAMQGILASGDYQHFAIGSVSGGLVAASAKAAVTMADALISALEPQS